MERSRQSLKQPTRRRRNNLLLALHHSTHVPILLLALTTLAFLNTCIQFTHAFAFSLVPRSRMGVSVNVPIGPRNKYDTTYAPPAAYAHTTSTSRRQGDDRVSNIPSKGRRHGRGDHWRGLTKSTSSFRLISQQIRSSPLHPQMEKKLLLAPPLMFSSISFVLHSFRHGSGEHEHGEDRRRSTYVNSKAANKGNADKNRKRGQQVYFRLWEKVRNIVQRRPKQKIQWEWEPRPLPIENGDDNGNSSGNSSAIVDITNSNSTKEEESNGASDDTSKKRRGSISSNPIKRRNISISQKLQKKSQSPGIQKAVKGFVRFVTLAILVTVIAPFMRLDEDEYGDITGVSFKTAHQIGGNNGVALNPPFQKGKDGGVVKEEHQKNEMGGDDGGMGHDGEGSNSASGEDLQIDFDKSPGDGQKFDSMEKELALGVEENPLGGLRGEEDSNPSNSNSAIAEEDEGADSTIPGSKALASPTPSRVEQKLQPKSPPNAIYRTTMGYVAEAVAKTGPAVIRIDTETDIERAVHMGERVDGSQPGHDQRSGGDRDEMDDGIPDRLKFIQQGQGSGVIFCKEGLVLTNAHVVQGASRVTVTLTDGRRFRAEVKGTDDIVDIAVLKILFENDNGSENALPVAEFGDSDELQVGQFVVAVGSPGGLDNTVTMGIISGLKRSSEVVGLMHKKVDFIQTDAGECCTFRFSFLFSLSPKTLV